MQYTHQSRKRILVVDDDSAVRRAIALPLWKADYEVAEVEHAFGAVCAMVRTGADLIITDIRMPVVDGISLVRELRSHVDTREIPVVAVTGFDSPESRAAALKAGCVGYITKPIDARKFPGQIAEFIGEPG